MSRTYNIVFGGVSVTVAQDLIAATATANMAFEVIMFGLSPGTTTVENLLINLKRLAATVTAGSGGSSSTPTKDRSSDAAAVVTGRINDTTQATSSGATDYLQRSGVNLVNGYEFWFPERARPIIKPGEALIFELATAPAASRTLSGFLKFRELF